MGKVEELTVSGYIHSIESTLSNGLFIPLNIYEICLMYYIFVKQIFIYKRKTVPKIDIYYAIDTFKHQFGIIMIDNNNKITESIIKTNKCKLNQNFIATSFCYIQNPSIENNILNKKYQHGIFGFLCKDSQLFPFLLLFDTNKFEVKLQSKIAAITTVTRHNYNQIKTVIYCGNEHGLIYEDNGFLYQLKLKNITSKNEFTFTKININNDKYWAFGKIKKRVYFYLDLCFINTQNKLFAIQNHISTDGRKGKLKNRSQSYCMKCALYDFNKNKWKTIKTFEFNTKYAQSVVNGFQSSLYFNKRNNSIYMMTEIFKTNNILSKYNIKKNKWIQLLTTNENENPMNDKFLWGHKRKFKPVLLYDYNVNTMQLFQAPNIYYYMDLNKIEKQWQGNNNTSFIDNTNNNRGVHNQAFC
eukprot:285549_1